MAQSPLFLQQPNLIRFYQLALGSALSNMMVPLAGLCDIAFLGHLNDIQYLAGVILSSILFDYLYRILKFLRNSTNAITSHAVGENDPAAILLAGVRSALVAILVAAVILILQYPIQTLGFSLLAGSEEIKLAGVDYFNARIWGAPAVLLNFVLFGWFLGQEKTGVVLLVSLVGNGANVVLDYWMISRWGWGSSGAGLATALSQYLALGLNLVIAAWTVQWSLLPQIWPQIGDWQSLRSIVVLKSNILIRFTILISAYAIFTNLSATLGTTVLAENGLLLQIALLSQFTVNGVGMTTQTLIGQLQGQGEREQMRPVVVTALWNSLLIALIFALGTYVFPQQVFGLLSSHGDLNGEMLHYTIWLVPLLSLTAIAFILEGFFIGLKEGVILRNSAVTAFAVGFVPVAIAGWHFHSNHLLWSSLTVYMTALILLLGRQIWKATYFQPEESHQNLAS